MVDTQLRLIFRRSYRCRSWYFCTLRRPILSVCIIMAKSLINYLTYKAKNHWCSADAQFQNLAGSGSHSLLPIKATDTSFMSLCDQSPCRLTMMQSQTLLKLHWHSFSQWDSECATFPFACKCGLYSISEHRDLIAAQITQDTRPKVIDLPLTFIIRMGLLILIMKAANTCEKENDVPKSIFFD